MNNKHCVAVNSQSQSLIYIKNPSLSEKLKAICKDIKMNEIPNPENRRHIIWNQRKDSKT